MSSSHLKFGVYCSTLGDRQSRRWEGLKILACDSLWTPYSVAKKILLNGQNRFADGLENSSCDQETVSELLAIQLDGLTTAPEVVDMAIRSQVSPSSARLAGRHGMKLLSLSATTPGGFNALLPNREIYCRKAKEHKKVVNPGNWIMAGLVHIAPTRRQARIQVEQGLDSWLEKQKQITGYDLISPSSADPVEELCQSGIAIIGTAKDAIEQIKQLKTHSGGFGTFLTIDHSWANEQHTAESDDLFARKVMPVFQ